MLVSPIALRSRFSKLGSESVYGLKVQGLLGSGLRGQGYGLNGLLFKVSVLGFTI